MEVGKNEVKSKKSIYKLMRSLHRDIGFLVIGLTIIYCLSGIMLIFRGTDFLKKETLVTRNIDPNINPADLGMIMRVREVKVLKTEGDVVYFENGTYNSATGVLEYTSKELPKLLNKLNSFHKSSNTSKTHWFSIVYGILLFFLAISSFWMFKSRSKLFKRGILISAGGVIIVIVMLLM